MRNIRRPTSVQARPLWCAECGRAGTGVSGCPCGRANHLTQSSDRMMMDEWSVTPPPAAGGSAPAPSGRPSLWGSRLGSLRTARTNIPVKVCGTATKKHMFIYCLCFMRLTGSGKVQRYADANALNVSYFGLIAVWNHFKNPSLQVLHIRNAQSVKDNKQDSD